MAEDGTPQSAERLASPGGSGAKRWLGSRLLGFLIMLLLGLGGARAWAEMPAPQPLAPNPLQPLDTSSPSATYQSFLKEMRLFEAQFLAYSHHKSLAGEEGLVATVSEMRTLFDLGPLPPALRDKMGGAAIMYLADILNRLPEAPPETIPGAAGRASDKLPDKWRVPGTDITIARVATRAEIGDYLFTAETVSGLAHDQALIIHYPPLRPTTVLNWRQAQINLTGPLVPDEVVRALPRWALSALFGTPVWKAIASIIILALVFAIAIIWGGFAQRRAEAVEGHGSLRPAAWWLTRPILLFLLYVIGIAFIRSQLILSGGFATAEAFVSTIVLYPTLAWMTWTGCFFLAEAAIASPRIPDNSLDSHLLRLTARLLGFAGAVTLLLYGANALGIPALGLVAGLGVGGIAVALASQSTVENLIGGFSIFADRPFRVGDSILLGDTVSLVESIGPRSCRLRAEDGTLTTVPNSDLAKMHVTNYSMRNRCLFRHEISLRPETSPDQCERVIADIRYFFRAHPLVADTPGQPCAVLTAFGGGGITIRIEAVLKMTDWAAFLDVQQELLLGVMRLMENFTALAGAEPAKGAQER